jgi:hypothetical protein
VQPDGCQLPAAMLNAGASQLAEGVMNSRAPTILQLAACGTDRQLQGMTMMCLLADLGLNEKL